VLDVKSKALGDVPLAPKGVMEISLERSMVPVKKITMDVGSSLEDVGGIIPPQTVSKLSVSALLSQADIDLMGSGSFVFTVSLAYLGSSVFRYKTEPIPFTRQTITFQ
jgi:hypothetical protein